MARQIHQSGGVELDQNSVGVVHVDAADLIIGAGEGLNWAGQLDAPVK